MTADTLPPSALSARPSALQGWLLGGARLGRAPARLGVWLGADAMVVLLVLAMLLLWGPLAAAWHPQVSTDSLEQVLWASQGWQWVYAKHPPLPTWIYLGAAALVGPSVELTHWLGALCSVGALAVLYLWARPLVGARRAALAALLVSLVSWYNAGTAFYNHNTLQLPLSIAAIAAFHGLLARPAIARGALLGLVGGLLLLTKLSALLLFAAFALYLGYAVLAERRALRPLLLPLAVACALAATLAAGPLALLYLGQPEATQYVSESSLRASSLLRRLNVLWNFSASAFAALLPALLLFAALRFRLPRPAQPKAATGAPRLAPFLAIVGFAPFALVLLIGLVTGANLLAPWATALFTSLTLWLVACSPWRSIATRSTLGLALPAVLLLHAALLATLVLNHGKLPSFAKRHAPIPLPAPELARAIEGAWAEHSRTPLPAVATYIRYGAPIALGLQGRAPVYDGNGLEFERRAPAAQRAACGMVYVIGPSTAQALPERPLQPALDRPPVEQLAYLAALDGVSLLLPSTLRDGRPMRFHVVLQLPEPADGSACAAHAAGRV
jgi:hypothetical protein